MIENHCGRRSTLSRLTADVACVVALIVFPVIVSGAAQQGEVTESLKHDRSKRETVKRVTQYPDSPIEFTNFDAVPLSIQSAHAKEIGNAEYFALVGSATDSHRYTTFPKLILTNKTDQRITGVVLMYGNKQTKKIRGTSFTKLSIEPRGVFMVGFSDWILPERTVRIADDGRMTNRLRPGLDSEKMWSRGSAREFLVRIASVVFEDGKRWEMSSEMDW